MRLRVSCKICSKTFAENFQLESHVKRHTEKKDFECSFCGTFYFSDHDLKSHISLVHEKAATKKRCNFCNEFFNPMSLKRHINSKHTFSKIYSCDLCKYKTTVKQTLNQHSKSVHLGVMYPCQKCDYKASLSMNLKRHIRSKHEGKIFQCSICKAEYTDQGNLRRHQKVSHEGRRL